MVANVMKSSVQLKRQRDQWAYERRLADQDIRIGNREHHKSRRNHMRVVDQERTISVMSADSAQAVADFLVTKFTSFDLL